MSCLIKKIAILGATSHIAKGLIFNFSRAGKYKLYLFARSRDRLKEFLHSIRCEGDISIWDFAEFAAVQYDIVINCVGIRNPGKLKDDVSSIFHITETYDNLALDYLGCHPAALYVNFSSGAAYGPDFALPSNELTTAEFSINRLSAGDFYGITKLYSEAKHRSRQDLNIVDLRVFSYFSRFIDLEDKYLMSDIISCIRNGKVLTTGLTDIIRDYVHPHDLMFLIELCRSAGKINDVFDVYSRMPVKKSELLNHFAGMYGLKYVVDDDYTSLSVTGQKDNYYSTNRKSEAIGYSPRFTSLESVSMEAEAILAGAG